MLQETSQRETASTPGTIKPAADRRVTSRRAQTASAGVMERSFDAPADWRGRYGASLKGEELRLRFCGNLRGNFVIALGGISANRFVVEEEKYAGRKGWWSRIARVGGAIDLSRYSVIGFDYPPERAKEPLDLCPEDFADLLKVALDKAKIGRVSAFIGASFGGMIGLSFARKYPERLDRLCVISAAHRPSAMAQARRIVQRRIIEFARSCGKPAEGVALARQLAMTTYRSAVEFEARFSPEPSAPDNVGHYLEARGFDYAQKQSAARYLTLSAAIDRHDEEPEAIATPTLAVGVDTDELTPPAHVEELQRRLAGPSAHAVISSHYGHDAFLKETDALGQIIQEFLKEPLS